MPQLNRSNPNERHGLGRSQAMDPLVRKGQKKSLFGGENGDRPYASQLADLLVAGLRSLEAMTVSGSDVTYSDWASLTSQEVGQGGTAATENQLIWLWDAIRNEPGVVAAVGNLPAAGGLKRDKAERILVLASGEWLVIGLKPVDIHKLMGRNESSATEEPVAVLLLEQLCMRPGKADRLECCDAKASVIIKPEKVHSASREADIMCVPEADVTVSERSVRVRVKSLNQAYTVASRRLEPNRRSHGGRIYDHLIYAPAGDRILLGKIRKQVEAGKWPLSEKPSDIRPSAED